MGVWHLSNGTTLSANDSTINGNNGRVVGATVTTGKIGGWLNNPGASGYIYLSSTTLATATPGTFSLEAWVSLSGFDGWPAIVDFDANNPNNWGLYVENRSGIGVVVGNKMPSLIPSASLQAGWNHIVATWDGQSSTMYLNGFEAGSTWNDSSFGNGIASASIGLGYFGKLLNGLVDEVPVSTGIARSADWVAAEFSNQNSPAEFYALGTENDLVTISPLFVTLYASQSQQFTVAGQSACVSNVTWAINPGVGAISPSGLYTAPASITTQQEITVTANGIPGPSQPVTANITLTPPVSVSISPASATLYGGQTQQFTANVANATNTAVTWTITPPNIGTLSATGLYTAPATISALRAVTVTANSVTDPAKFSSAQVALIPALLCASNGYSYQRAITIDHTKVPNTDQTNFPFLFNTTDPAFKSTANGGPVTNPNGYDIIFTSDPAGQNLLDFEMEEYDPIHGQVIAWMRIPTLSHTTDTVLYMFYGNSSITTSQQNTTGVWDSNYMGVWHVANSNGQLSLIDSTNNRNYATNNGAVPTTGQIDGGMQTNGSTYATIGTPASLANLALGNATFSAWVNSASGAGGRIMGKDDGNGNNGWALGVDSNNYVNFMVIYGGSNFGLVSTVPVNNATWSHIVVTLAGSPNQSQATIYINGVPSGTGTGGAGGTADDSAQIAYLANATFAGHDSAPLNGSEDEFRISNTIRSADWISTEFSNQSSPSTFYTLGSDNDLVSPSAVILSASQSQQFTVAGWGACGSNVSWSITPKVGSINALGVYTAPGSITTEQAVTITVSSIYGSNQTGTATITLMPPPIFISVTPASATLSAGQTMQFNATVKGNTNTAVTWALTPNGFGTISSTGLYTAPATITGQQSVIVTATSQVEPTIASSSVVTIASARPNIIVTANAGSAIFIAVRL
jgi:hypothetical protein